MDPENHAENGAAPARARLDGWKEIAAYLGKGVRTVQRWEAELQLPVLRIVTGRGQVPYAFVDELERWRESSAARAAASEAVVPIPHPRRRTRFVAGVAVGAVAVAALFSLPGLWTGGVPGRGGPASAKVIDDALTVLDASGRVLWEHRFEFQLDEAFYAELALRQEQGPILIDDVDGDGTSEVLFVAEPWQPDGHGLYCFNADGSIRFHHEAAGSVEYGEKRYAAPWRGVAVYASGPAGGPHDIWLVSTHVEEFPTLLEKLDGHGNPKAAYWNDGHIKTVVTGEVGGRAVVFVGGINNEFKGGSLAVLDARNPSGSAPAGADHYRCRGCPPGGPLAFMVFPRLHLTAAIGTHSHVKSVHVDKVGQIFVGVSHHVGNDVPQELKSSATTHYEVDRHFHVIAAELGERLPQIHGLFERQGLVDHPFSLERDSQFLWPVRRWDGSTFVEVTGPEARDPE